jgi:hypothetical protein
VGGNLVTWDIVRAAQNRVWIHDDPCAEYELSDGTIVVASDIVEAANA